jgi:hypothetical protein
VSADHENVRLSVQVEPFETRRARSVASRSYASSTVSLCFQVE